MHLKPLLAIGASSFLLVRGTAEGLSHTRCAARDCVKWDRVKQNKCGKNAVWALSEPDTTGKVCRSIQKDCSSHPLWVMDSRNRMSFRWPLYPEETARPIFGAEVRGSSRLSWEEAQVATEQCAVRARHPGCYPLFLRAP